MNYETIASTLSIIIASVLAVLQTIEAIKKNKSENVVSQATADKILAERQELEERITEKVLQRAEAELNKLRMENEKLHNDNIRLLMENNRLRKMMRELQLLLAKLVSRMESASIDPELTEEERRIVFGDDLGG